MNKYRVSSLLSILLVVGCTSIHMRDAKLTNQGLHIGSVGQSSDLSGIYVSSYSVNSLHLTNEPKDLTIQFSDGHQTVGSFVWSTKTHRWAFRGNVDKSASIFVKELLRRANCPTARPIKQNLYPQEQHKDYILLEIFFVLALFGLILNFVTGYVLGFLDGKPAKRKKKL